ncbi:MAG: ATP-binding protein [Euryarchaeota archaeon]|nr:ATP-binding protein [Euryarchaeota archaeon]
MEVAIKNLGPIRKAKIELKPLTIFIGQNNTGKTLTASLISAILSDYGWREYTNAYSEGSLPETYPQLEDSIKQLLEQGEGKIDLVEFLNEYGSTYFNSVAMLSRSWAQKFFGTTYASFQNVTFNINLEYIKNDLVKNISGFEIKGQLAISSTDAALLNVIKERGSQILYFFTTKKTTELQSSNIEYKIPQKAIKKFIVEQVFMLLHRALYIDSYFFPAERTDLTGIAASCEVNPIPKQTDENTKDFTRTQLVPLAFPISSLMERIANTRRFASLIARQKQAEKDPWICKYLEFANILQSSVLGGRLDFSSSEPDPLRELIFEPADGKGVRLDMPVVSSMVKELSSLVLYLRYVAHHRDLLVIDEPEMHLHPEAQAKLTEFLAMLVNAELNIIITTHSPYLVDHLLNLMKAAEYRKKVEIKDKFFLRRTDAFISKDKVSVFLFDNNTAKNIKNKRGLINWETFNRVSEQILQLKMEF